MAQASTSDPRPYEIVIFGANGVTGKYCAEHVATHLPTDLRWAVAGRNESKLRAVVDDIRALNPDRKPPAIEACAVDDEALGSLALKTRVLVACVGPYSLHGEAAFRACAEAGTAYVDTTGEVPWVAAMIAKHEAAAKRTGAVLVSQCGFESAASDMLVREAVATVRRVLAADTAHVSGSLRRVSGGLSGGTLATVFTLFDVFGPAQLRAAMEPFALSPVPHPHPTSAPRSLLSRLTGVHVDPLLGGPQASWLFGPANAAIVQRTWGLLTGAAEDAGGAKTGYGPRFTYAETLTVGSRLTAVAINVGLAVGAAALALAPPLRWVARRLVRQPGLGPSDETNARSFCDMRAVAEPDDHGAAASGKKVVSRLYWKGSIYHLTAVFLVEAAMTLLRDAERTPAHAIGGGVLTPACLGEPFADRLRKAGVTLEAEVV